MGKLKLKNSSLEIAWIYSTIKDGVKEVQNLENYQKQKLNPNLVRSTAKFVQEEIDKLPKKIKRKINKIEIVKEINKQAFNLNEEELEILLTIVEDGIDNKLIKSPGLFRQGLKFLRAYLIASKTQ